MPNEIPFELLKMTVPLVAVCVPAALLTAGCTVCAGKLADAVICELPLIPKVTLLLFENTNVPVETDCVPADSPNGVSAGTLAVMTDEFDMPNEIPFELLHTTVPEVAVCVPAAAFTAGWTVCAGKLADAVTIELFDIPNDTLFEFE